MHTYSLVLCLRFESAQQSVTETSLVHLFPPSAALQVGIYKRLCRGAGKQFAE